MASLQPTSPLLPGSFGAARSACAHHPDPFGSFVPTSPWCWSLLRSPIFTAARAYSRRQQLFHPPAQSAAVALLRCGEGHQHSHAEHPFPSHALRTPAAAARGQAKDERPAYVLCRLELWKQGTPRRPILLLRALSKYRRRRGHHMFALSIAHRHSTTAQMQLVRMYEADTEVVVRRRVTRAQYVAHMTRARFCPICGGFSQWTPREDPSAFSTQTPRTEDVSLCFEMASETRYTSHSLTRPSFGRTSRGPPL